MRLIRIGSRVLNLEAIAEATDEAEVKLGTERQRVVTLKLTTGTKLEFAGEEADRIWERITEEAEVWLETHEPPQASFGFH